MKKKKRTKILFLVLVCMLLNACGREKEEMMPDTEEPDYVVDGETFLKEDEEQEIVDEADSDNKNGDEQPESPEESFTSGKRIEIIPAQKADIPKKENESGRALTAEELQFFDEMIKKNGYYGFLLSAYDTPADANLNEILYNGLGADQEIITEDEVQAYLEAVGESELFTDFNKITATQLNDFLLEKTGLSYEQMNTKLGWTYLTEFDAYYSQHGDTNYRIFNCKEGYADVRCDSNRRRTCRMHSI